MKIFIATDHAGFNLKEEVKKFLTENLYEVTDCGALTLNPDDDYPDFIKVASKKVAENENSFGIVFGGSGQGEAICANKIRGIRAAVYNSNNLDVVKFARLDNDANVLSIGARFVEAENTKNAVKLFLETPFSNEVRHKRRIDKITDLERNG